MQLHTSVVYSPGTDGEGPGQEQVLVVPHHGLLAVADSRSPEYGRVAARLAIDQVRGHIERNADLLDRFRRTPTPDLREQVLATLEDAIARAAQETFAFGRRRGAVAVTLDVLLVLDHEAFVGHVGDGRVYLIRRGLVHQLTVDHFAAEDGFATPKASARDGSAADEPHELNVLGLNPQVRPESLCIETAPDDRFVVCGSSIHRVLPDGLLHTRMCSEHLDHLPVALADDAPYSPLLGACAQLDGQHPFTVDSAQARLSLLAPMPLFTHCTERELRSVAQATHPRRFRAGAVVFEEGQPGTELFLVIAGRLAVVRDGRPIAHLSPGSTFGEMAMLDEPNRSATVHTIEDTELLVISRHAFFGLLRGHPRLAMKVLWNLLLGISSNLRRTNERLAVLERELQLVGDPQSE
jgi:PPM family protein phosphatase